MKKIEQFLNSIYFIIFIFLIVFVSWFMGSGFFGLNDFSPYNLYGVYVLILLLSVVLVLFKNTLYAIPILAGFLFIISNSSITFDTLDQFGFPHIALILIFSSFIVHIIRFRPRLKIGGLFTGLLLIAIAYVIPLLYTEVSMKAVMVSSAGIIYFLFYLFLFSTTKGNKDYLFKLMLVISFILMMQLGTKIFRLFLDHPELNFIEVFGLGMTNNWGDNFGWANINDVAFYLTLTFPTYVYFIFKKPKNIFYWLLILLPILAVAVSGSRGGLIGFFIVGVLSFVFIMLRGTKHHYLGVGIAVLGAFIIIILSYDILKESFSTMLDMLNRGSIDAVSSNRIFIYVEGIKFFKENFIFGAGWMSISSLNADFVHGRLFMYHSTIIHVLATMGLFGLFALLFHYYQVFSVLFYKISLEKKLIMFGYIATQIHGLIDNVQFSVPYSFLIVFIFVIIETSDIDTLFKKDGRKYIYDESLQLSEATFS
ncbi:MAG: O-antigen ligase family protein [Acholeplasmataceae bacterium]